MQLGVREAARLLRVSEETLYRWVREERVPVAKFGEECRFHRAELLEWATAEGIGVSPDLCYVSSGVGEPVRMADALRLGGVFADIGGEDRGAVLAAVVERVPLPGGMDRGFLLEMLRSREAAGSTAVGEGVALPHARCPVVLDVDDPVLYICHLRHGVDFEAPDGLPVTVLFVLVTPSVHEHLQMLSHVGFALTRPQVRAALGRRAGLEEMADIFDAVEEEWARRKGP